jgi:hypothetical protein
MAPKGTSDTGNYKRYKKQFGQSNENRKQHQIHEMNRRGEMESLSFDSTLQNTKVDADHKTPVININLQLLGLKIYSGVIEIMKVTFLILAFLAIYKVLGAHDWWIQFLDKLVW